MNEAIVDFAEMTDALKIHELLNKQVFHMDGYGHNLNALHDVFYGIAPRPFMVTFKNISEAFALPVGEAYQLIAMVTTFLGDSTRVEKGEGTNITFYFED